MGKTILAVGAHHDDIELRAGGTVAKYAAKGWNFVYAIASTTPSYKPTAAETRSGKYLSTEDVTELRKSEASKGAGILGAAEVHFLDYRSIYWYAEGTHDKMYLDGVKCTSEDLRFLEEKIRGREFIVSAHRVKSAVRFMADFIAGHEPEIVLTHSADDRHWEHYATARLVFEAVKSLREEKDISLYGWRFGSGGTMHHSFKPERFEDITETIDVKCEALRVFKSQWGANTGETASRARRTAEKYGELCGYEYAEPFLEFNFAGTGHDYDVPRGWAPPANIMGLE